MYIGKVGIDNTLCIDVTRGNYTIVPTYTVPNLQFFYTW